MDFFPPRRAQCGSWEVIATEVSELGVRHWTVYVRIMKTHAAVPLRRNSTWATCAGLKSVRPIELCTTPDPFC